MQIKKLYELAEENNIKVEGFPLKETQAVTIQIGDKNFVAIDTSVLCSPSQEKVCLAHELGHCQTGAFYNEYSALDERSRHEKKAERWAIERLVPLKALQEVIKNGCDDLQLLCDHFGVPSEFMCKALIHYQKQQ